MKIQVVSHEMFDSLCYDDGLNDENVDKVETRAFISIIGTEECRKYYLEDETTHWFKEEHNNVLNLEFDDVTEDTNWNGKVFKAMTEKQADKCIDFIERNKEKDFLIHCKAGISRSGAFGQFIYDFFSNKNENDKKDFERYNSHIRPNNHVLRLLKRSFYKKNGLFVDKNKDF